MSRGQGRRGRPRGPRCQTVFEPGAGPHYGDPGRGEVKPCRERAAVTLTYTDTALPDVEHYLLTGEVRPSGPRSVRLCPSCVERFRRSMDSDIDLSTETALEAA